MNIKYIKWYDESSPKGERTWLALIHSGKVTLFRGKTLRGLAVVTHRQIEDGPWGPIVHYLIECPDNVRAIPGFGELRDTLRYRIGAYTPIDTWAQLAARLGVDEAEARCFVRAEFPAEAAELDKVELHGRGK
jgi:hypothetical protein